MKILKVAKGKKRQITYTDKDQRYKKQQPSCQ